MNSTTSSLTFQRQIGGNKGGRLIRSSVAKTSKGRRNVSIPSKYTTTFVEKGRQSGFGSSTIRFNYLMEPGQEIPGPGNYNLYNQKLWRDNAASNSRKGYGGFVSGVERNLEGMNFMNTGPGPGAYESKFSINTRNSSTTAASDASRKARTTSMPTTSKFRTKKNLMKHDYTKNLGPGRYNLNLGKRKTNAGFTLKSRTKRLESSKNRNPAPGRYKIPRDILKKKPFKIKGPMSSFAKTVRRKEVNLKEKEKIKEKIDKGVAFKGYRGEKEEDKPGPCDYDGAKSKDFFQYRKPMSIKGNSFFLNGPKRFNLDKDQVKNPGPGTYKKKSDFDVDSYRVFGAAFMSETERKAFKVKKLNDRFAPYNNTMKPIKESFHFNIKTKPRFIP